jgi:hypothetical protein
VIVITCLREVVTYFRIDTAVRESTAFAQVTSPPNGRFANTSFVILFTNARGCLREFAALADS